jgi:hypothetical protein
MRKSIFVPHVDCPACTTLRSSRSRTAAPAGSGPVCAASSRTTGGYARMWSWLTPSRVRGPLSRRRVIPRATVAMPRSRLRASARAGGCQLSNAAGASAGQQRETKDCLRATVLSPGRRRGAFAGSKARPAPIRSCVDGAAPRTPTGRRRRRRVQPRRVWCVRYHLDNVAFMISAKSGTALDVRREAPSCILRTLAPGGDHAEVR